MARGLNDLFASREKVEDAESKLDAVAMLQLELLQTLMSKNILSSEEVQNIFSSAIEKSFVDAGESLNLMYRILTNDLDDDTNDDEDEDEDYGEDEDEDEDYDGEDKLPKVE